jgi:uncharacterized protein
VGHSLALHSRILFGGDTSPRIYSPPSTPIQALDQLDAWLASPTLVLLAEGPGRWQSLRLNLLNAKIAGPAVHDARIAALCLQHGIKELWSADRDFSRFAALRTVNPLVAAAMAPPHR